jgi:hypothetical protein
VDGAVSVTAPIAAKSSFASTLAELSAAFCLPEFTLLTVVGVPVPSLTEIVGNAMIEVVPFIRLI